MHGEAADGEHEDDGDEHLGRFPARLELALRVAHDRLRAQLVRVEYPR